MISPALVTVFLPKLSAKLTDHSLVHFLRLVACVCLMVSAAVIAYVVALRTAFPLLGSQYRQAFPVAGLLLGGTVLLIAYNMVSLVLLAADRPEYFGGIALIMAAFSLAANFFAVPWQGALGAAEVYGSSQVLGIALAIGAIRRLRRRGVLCLRLAAQPATGV